VLVFDFAGREAWTSQIQGSRRFEGGGRWHFVYSGRERGVHLGLREGEESYEPPSILVHRGKGKDFHCRRWGGRKKIVKVGGGNGKEDWIHSPAGGEKRGFDVFTKGGALRSEGVKSQKVEGGERTPCRPSTGGRKGNLLGGSLCRRGEMGFVQCQGGGRKLSSGGPRW